MSEYTPEERQEILEIRERAFWIAKNFFDEDAEVGIDTVLAIAEKIYNYLFNLPFSDREMSYNELSIEPIEPAIKEQTLETVPLAWNARTKIVCSEPGCTTCEHCRPVQLKPIEPVSFEATIPLTEIDFERIFTNPEMQILRIDKSDLRDSFFRHLFGTSDE